MDKLPCLPHTTICEQFLHHFLLLFANLLRVSIDDQSISPSMLGWLPPALGPSCLSVLGLLFAYVHNFLLFTSWGGKIRHSGRDCFSFTWPVLPETDTQAEPGKSVHWALSRSQCPSVKMGDFLHAVPDGRTDEPNLTGSLLITVQLVLRHSLTQKQPGFRPQPCKGKRRRRLGRSRRPSCVRGCISDGRVCGGIQGGGKSW